MPHNKPFSFPGLVREMQAVHGKKQTRFVILPVTKPTALGTQNSVSKTALISCFTQASISPSTSKACAILLYSSLTPECQDSSLRGREAVQLGMLKDALCFTQL